MILIKILGIVSFILVTFGNGLILVIVHYEKFGQDSKKRSFADQIFTFSCLLFLIFSYVNDILLEIRSIFGPIGSSASMLIYYLRSTMLAIPLGYAESILYKCAMIFWWNKCAMLNDEFLATFFGIFNLIIGQLISGLRVMLGEFYQREEYAILSGFQCGNRTETW